MTKKKSSKRKKSGRKTSGGGKTVKTGRAAQGVEVELTGARLPSRAACVLVALIAIIPFLNIFGNQFVSYDDDKIILDNPQIRQLDAGGVRDIMLSFVPGQPHLIDFPLTHISWAVNYRLGGYNPWGYHFGNVALHLVTCLLLYALLLKGPWGRGAALWASLFFAAHPIHVESVTWMTGRKDVLSAALMLAALLLYVYYLRSRRPWRTASVLALSIFLWSAAFLAKPTAIMFPGLIALWVLFAEPRSRLKRGLAGLAPFAPLAALFLWSQVVVSMERGIVTDYIGGSFAESLRAIGYILLFNARLVAMPVYLSAHYPFTVSTGPGILIGSWVVVVAGAGLLMLRALRRPGILFYPLWFFVSLVPVLQFIPTRIPVADRYLYIPSVAFCLALAVAVGKARRALRVKYPRAVFAVTVSLSVLLGAYVAGTLVRNTVWRDSESLWADTVRKSPGSPLALNNLALIYEKRGDIAEAENLYQRAISEAPRYFPPYVNLGVICLKRGEMDEGIGYLSTARRLDPNDPAVLQNLAVAYINTRRPREAIDAAKQLLDIQADNEAAGKALCRAYTLQDDEMGARRYCKEPGPSAGEGSPGDEWDRAGRLFAAGRVTEALAIYKKFTELKPGYAPAWVNLGLCYQFSGDNAAAVAMWRHALEVDPASEKARKYIADYATSGPPSHIPSGD